MSMFHVYEKVWETETEVEYVYGDINDPYHAKVVIDKANLAGTAESLVDRAAQMVIGEVLESLGETGCWPAEGMIRSG